MQQCVRETEDLPFPGSLAKELKKALEKPQWNFSLGIWANTVFSSKEQNDIMTNYTTLRHFTSPDFAHSILFKHWCWRWP